MENCLNTYEITHAIMILIHYRKYYILLKKYKVKRVKENPFELNWYDRVRCTAYNYGV